MPYLGVGFTWYYLGKIAICKGILTKFQIGNLVLNSCCQQDDYIQMVYFSGTDRKALLLLCRALLCLLLPYISGQGNLNGRSSSTLFGLLYCRLCCCCYLGLQHFANTFPFKVQFALLLLRPLLPPYIYSCHICSNKKAISKVSNWKSFFRIFPFQILFGFRR